MTDFNREMLMCAESSVEVFSEGEVGVSYCCRNQIPCLCKASLLSTVLCFPLIFHVLFSTLNLPLTHHVRSGRGWGDRSQYMAAAVCVEHMHSSLWHLRVGLPPFCHCYFFLFLSMP